MKTRKLSYQPGLDGLRALAVLSTFLVHTHIAWAPGGFLGVSTFFTLSGFLIMALLAREKEGRGSIDLLAFWQRRVRRLLPAAIVTVFLAVIGTMLFGDAHQIDQLAADVISTLAYVANWRFIFQEATYAGEFGGQSPLLHFWSLAIEEQFYLVFPLIMVAAMSFGRGWRHRAAITLLIGVLLSVVMGIVGYAGDWTTDQLYFRTDVRASELLIGALAGLWWVGPGQHVSAFTHSVIRWTGAAALLCMLALIFQSGYQDSHWYLGGFSGYALISVAVILAAVEDRGPVRLVLSSRPLVAIGVISYGCYLYHWPLFMWLYTETPLSGVRLLLVGTLLCFLVAGLSYRYLERPIREGTLAMPRMILTGGAAVAVSAVVLAVLAPRMSQTDTLRLEDAAIAVQALPTRGDGSLPAVGVFGDSTALMIAVGLAYADKDALPIRPARGWAELGCTLSAPGQFRVGDRVARRKGKCEGWPDKWRHVSDLEGLDIAVIHFGAWEVRSAKPSGWEEFLVVGEDSRRDEFIRQRLREGIESLDRTPLIVLLTSPYIEPGRVRGRSPVEHRPDGDTSRMDRLNDILIEVAYEYPNIAIIDFASWVQTSLDERRLRPDGIHFSREAATEIAPALGETLALVADVFAGKTPPDEGAPVPAVIRYVVAPETEGAAR